MKKIDVKMPLATCLVCIVPVFFGVYHYNKLPDMIPVHFNYKNVPDNYAPKLLGIIGIPVILLVLQAVLCIINDLADRNARQTEK